MCRQKFILIALLFGIATPATAADLFGTVRDAITEQAISNAVITVQGETRVYETTTRTDGFFFLEVPDAQRFDITVEVADSITTWKRRPVETWLELPVLTPYSVQNSQASPAKDKLGIPGTPEGITSQPAFLPKQATYPATTLPYPETIRVAMHLNDDCTEPIEEIVEVPFETYVEGVVYSEIGVFRGLPGGPDSAVEAFKVFAVAARSYALWFYMLDPDAEYHINNTACNQRFEELTAPSITQAVEATHGIIMTSDSDSSQLDKLEYAASCGRTDTLPEYGTIRDNLISDAIPESDKACVSNWCGHDSCAAHQEHPDYPDRGRCLVRGICQWGSAERSVRGEAWEEIIEHYQPNLQLTDLHAPLFAPLVGFVREGDIQSGTAIEGATIVAGDEQTTTDANGYYSFDSIEVGNTTISVQADGYHTNERSKSITYGVTNWASIALEQTPPIDNEDITDGDSDAEHQDTADDTEPTDSTSDLEDSTKDGETQQPPDTSNQDTQSDTDSSKPANKNSSDSGGCGCSTMKPLPAQSTLILCIVLSLLLTRKRLNE